MTRFPLGRVVATSTLLAHVAPTKTSLVPYLERHQRGDWGNLGRSDKQANEDAILNGSRILSKYLLKDGTPIYVITEWDRSVTTVMLVSDY